MTLAVSQLRPDPLAMAAARLRAGHRVRAGLQAPVFANPEQQVFYESQAPEILYSGWMGAGKSRILCEKGWAIALEHPGVQVGLFRKVHKSLAATTERTFWRDVADPRYVVGRNKTESWVDVSAGGRPSRIYFLGLDPDPVTGVPSKVGSLDLAWAGVDEAVEVTAADWVMLQGRLRDPGVPYHQLAAATNPASPAHWLKARFTPPTERRVYLNASGNRFLPDDYRDRLAELGDDPVGLRLGKGLWVAAQGQIYLLPDEQVRPAEQSAWRRRVGGLDWGFVHAFAAEVVGETGAGRRAVLDELYVRGELLDDIIPDLLVLQERHKIEVWYADPSEPEYIAKCRKHGVRITEATNDVLPGINAVNASIRAGMTVDPKCTGLLQEIPEYVWQTERGSNAQTEKPVKLGDDACDALRYAVMGLETGPGILTALRDQLEAQRAAEKAAHA